MTVGSASFYRLRGSFSTGEYPLLAAGQDLTSYRLNQATVKYAAGLQTEVTVPMFSSYQDVNVIELDGSYYWATAWRESTTYNGSVTYTCDYMAPTSLLKSGQSISAYLERSPTYICTYLSDDYSKGLTGINNTNVIGVGMNTHNMQPMYWAQITGVDTNGDYRRFGCFCTIRRNGRFSDPNIGVHVVAPPTAGAYPSIHDIINDVASFTPFTAETVKDISISARAPYLFTDVTIQSGVVTIHTVALGASSNDYITPTQNGSGSLLTYDIDSLISNDNLPIRPIQTISFSPTTAIRMSGHYIVRDWNMNIIASFPVGEGSTFSVQTYSDYSGIFTVITNGKRLLTIPEGKLPYAGSGWDTYMAYSMVADRQALSNAIGYAERERNVGMIGGAAESIISGAISGALIGGPVGAGVGVATGGLSAIGSVISGMTQYDLEVGRLRDNQDLIEMRAKNSAGSGYNTAYGLIYLTLTADSANLVIGTDLPANDSSSLLAAYTDRVGYPCEGLQTLSVVNGYYQGYIPASAINNGMFFDDLNRRMRQGFKFVSP